MKTMFVSLSVAVAMIAGVQAGQEPEAPPHPDVVAQMALDAVTDAKITKDPAMLAELAKAEYAAAVAVVTLRAINEQPPVSGLSMQDLDAALALRQKAVANVIETTNYVDFLRIRAGQLAAK